VFYLGDIKDKDREKREWILNERPYFDINYFKDDKINLVFYNKSKSIIHNTDVYIMDKPKQGDNKPKNLIKHSMGHRLANIPFSVPKDNGDFGLLIATTTLAGERVYGNYNINTFTKNGQLYKECEKLKNRKLRTYGYISIEEDKEFKKLLAYCEQNS
jgi:hypothetical protein